CVACHTHRSDKPAGGLVLDDAEPKLPAFGHDAGPNVNVPATYFRLAARERFKAGELGLSHDSATRYVRKFQSRRSLPAWKAVGKRRDGHINDDFPSLTVRNDPRSLLWRGKPVEKLDYNDEQKLRYYIRDNVIDVDYTGSAMPPPEAVKAGKVKPL